MNSNKSKKRQTSRIGPKIGKEPEILVESKFVEEDLPLQFVLYPQIGGTFIGFSSNPDGEVFFCSCMEPAIDNYISLINQNPKGTNSNPLVMAPLSSLDFPPQIAKKSQKKKLNEVLKFKQKLCHRCNMATPTVRAINPMYGGKFSQYYAWYIRQTGFRIGIYKLNYIKDYAPDELTKIIDTINKKLKEIQDMVNRPGSGAVLPGAYKTQMIQEQISKLKRKVSKQIENITREEFGFRKIGEGNVSETILTKIVERIFPEYEIYKHHRPEWLDGLELDIYIPKLNLGIEYQGQQHFHPIKAWGGKKALEALIERDALKKDLCKDQNIKLVEVDYTESLNREYIQSKINNALE